MGVLGKKVFDLMAKEVGGESAARLTLWRFDFFHSMELTRVVSHQAEAADVLIIAPRDPNRLPAQVNAWLEQWPVRRKLETGALVAVFHSDASSVARSNDSALLLWRAATRARMDFICHSGQPADAHTTTRPLTITTRAVSTAGCGISK